MSELPPICPDGKHEWRKHRVSGCGYGSGDHVTDEGIVIVDESPARDGASLINAFYY